MDSKLHNQLEEAKIHFYAGRLLESYHILRRYFDRLPFQPEKEHAEHIGMFIRALLELGKEFELKFYMGELERLYAQTHNLHMGYTLGMVYFMHTEPRIESARAIFETIARNTNCPRLRIKAKLMLANYYDVKEDIATVRLVIDTVEPSDDKQLELTVESWRAKVMADEKKFEDSEKAYLELLSKVEPEENWYNYSYTLLGYVQLLVRKKELERAQKVLSELKEIVSNRSFKLLEKMVTGLEEAIRDVPASQVIFLRALEKETALTFINKTLKMKRASCLEKLVLLFDKNRCVDKETIVQSLYDRSYLGEEDDKLVYYHIHSLRKKLRELGLSHDVIGVVEQGYKFVPRIEKVLEEI